MPLLTPIEESSKKPSEWILNSDFPTSLSYAIGMRRSQAEQSQKAILLHERQISTSPRHPDDDYAIQDSPSEVIEEKVNEVTTTNFATRLKIQFLKAFGIDGLNTTTNKITCADGMVASYSSNSLPLRFVITSLLGMPNRPGTIIDGVPQLSFVQFLRNWVGGWTRITVQSNTGTYVLGDAPVKESPWTTKKVVQIFAIPFKIAILLFKIATLPFKILLNAVKLVTEFALPLISFYTAVLNINIVKGMAWLGQKAFTRDNSIEEEIEEESENTHGVVSTRSVTNYSKWKAGLFFFGLIPMVATTIAILVFQYATVLLCRAGRALTSPAESAHRAYALGRSVKIGERGSRTRTVISYIMGILGLVVSLGVSALLWTLALPFALSTVTTWIPSLINAINWIAQLPAVSATLTWISSSSLATGSMVLLNNLFATVGTALSAAFGPAITAIAGVISVQVPAVVLAVGTTLGMLGMPVAVLLSLGADKLSNLWAQWTDANPLSKLSSLLSSLRFKPKLITRAGLTFTNVLYTYQPKPDSSLSEENPTLETVVSTIALDLTKNQHLVERAVYHDNRAQQIFDLVTRQDPNKKTAFRFPTPAELSDLEIQKAATEPPSSMQEFDL